MDRLEILVEEKSMEEFLRRFLPNILHSKWELNKNYFIRSFEGKTDLQKSLPKQIRAFSHWHEQVAVIVLQDQDSSDCKILKQKLKKLIEGNGNLPFLIRIVCKELESWYLGDFEAIHNAYPNFKSSNYKNKAKYRNPDQCNASEELRKILPEFQKVGSAKKISPFIDWNKNRSESLKQFASGVLKFTS